MKKILLAGVAALGFGSVASAADLPARMPVKAPPIIAPVFSWTGCYIGAHVGGAWMRKEWSDPFLGPGMNPFNSHDGSGVMAGGQIGCDYQVANWVFGIEGQGSWTDLKASSVDPLGTNETDHSELDAIGSVTGRIGYAWDRALFYAKGGGAWARDEFWIADTLFGANGGLHYDGGTRTRSGWTVGAGF